MQKENDKAHIVEKDCQNYGNGSAEEQLYPAVAMYGPYTVRNLAQGETKLWCTCGLSKRQPWCDGSHKGTGFQPLKWTVDKTQSLYQICACKYTESPPYCDGTHTNLPCDVIKRQRNCSKRESCHQAKHKLCTGCGWIPDF